MVENNLHLMGYSAPVDSILTMDQLLKKIYTQPSDKSAIEFSHEKTGLHPLVRSAV